VRTDLFNIKLNFIMSMLLDGDTIAKYGAWTAIVLVLVIPCSFCFLVLPVAYLVTLGGQAMWFGLGLVLLVPLLVGLPGMRRARKGRIPLGARRVRPPSVAPPTDLWDHELDAIPAPEAQYGRGTTRMRG
jgi:hypothetical protein